VHAAGVVVAKDDLRKFAPVESRADIQDKVSGRIPVIAYDMATAADIGLIKLDALGLKTLSVISDTLKSIKDRTGKDIDLSKTDMDDKSVYKMLNDGYTRGVFQAEATPYTNLLIKMGIDKFEDLAASNALVRPGAMNTVGSDYISRKNGKSPVKYVSPLMKPFTENTYGVIIYQEQVMQACVHLGGMSWAEADKVRKIIGKKKDAKEFDQFKDKFITGASEHIPKKKAEALWQDFEAHAGYSFNRSHAVAYSMLSYYTAWLKKHYPLEFMFSILKNENDKDARTEYLIEAKRLGLKVLLPHINPRVRAQARAIEDFDDLGSFVMFGMVKSIKRGNGWARVEIVDETGSIGLFHNEQTQIEAGQMYFILVGDNRISGYVKASDINPESENMFVKYLYSEEYDIDDDEYIVISFLPYQTKAGKTMSHIVLSNKNKELTRAIAFPTMYKMTLAKMREGMKCRVVLSTLDDGTLNVKEIK